MKDRITSKELAKLVGVSSATISRAFSGDARISAQTRARVLAMAQQYGYQPNAIARTLNNRQSDLVAVVVNAIVNPCEAQQLEMLVHQLQARSLVPIILCCGNTTERLQLMRLASTYQVDHAIIFSDLVPLKEAMQIFRTARLIIVSDEPIEDARISSVRFDGAQGAAQIIEKILADGRKHFAYLCGRNSSWIDKQRRDWFGDALARHGLAFEVEAHGDYSYDSGFKEASLLLRRTKVDALVCGNDIMAIGARDAAVRLLGRQVPGDLAIVGQDGIAMAGWECHDLTTLALDQVAFIDAIVELVERQETDNTAASTTVMKCTARWGSTA
ncbi:MAG: LacI family DNA-binding transcriptional regulator [Chthoniobacterales bacterium]